MSIYNGNLVFCLNTEPSTVDLNDAQPKRRRVESKATVLNLNLSVEKRNKTDTLPNLISVLKRQLSELSVDDLTHEYFHPSVFGLFKTDSFSAGLSSNRFSSIVQVESNKRNLRVSFVEIPNKLSKLFYLIIPIENKHYILVKSSGLEDIGINDPNRRFLFRDFKDVSKLYIEYDKSDLTKVSISCDEGSSLIFDLIIEKSHCSNHPNIRIQDYLTHLNVDGILVQKKFTNLVSSESSSSSSTALFNVSPSESSSASSSDHLCIINGTI